MQATVSNLIQARSAQHEYLMGLVLDDKRNINTITCPCGGAIQWRHGLARKDDGDQGKCAEKCGHEFIYREQEIQDNHATDEDGEPITYTRETIYCRRKMNGHDWHIGELVTWRKYNAPRYGHQLNIPMDSPFWDWAEYTGHDSVFLVIGVELSGDRVLVATQDGGKWKTLNPVEAREITETTRFYYIGCFWCPIECLESVSEWPYIDENA